MRITDLLEDAILSEETKNLCVRHLTANPRAVTRDSLFFLTEGVSFDKRRLLPYITAKRPAAIVLPLGAKDFCDEIPTVHAQNPRRALAQALFRFYGLSETRMKFVAVTGTNGKTTTATMLYHILKTEGVRVGFIGTGKILYGDIPLAPPFYSMTTPDPELLYPTLAKMEAAGCECIVMEASSHAIALEKLAPLRFAAAIFTNLSAEHLDFHKDMESYFETKARLFSQADLAIVNADDPYGRRLAASLPAEKLLTTGALFESDISARSIEDYGLRGCRFMYKSAGPSFFVHLCLSGIYQIYNAMPAIAAAISLGIPPCKARRAIEALTEISGRMECIASEDISVYIDYAHTPEALRSALCNAKKSLKKDGRLWLVFGCGGERDREKRPKMARIAEEEADRVILTLDNCRSESPLQILKEVRAGFLRGGACIISNRSKAIRFAILSMQPKDTLIIAGKGHESYTVDKNGYRAFDERKIITDALKERKGGHTLLYENQADEAADGQRD